MTEEFFGEPPNYGNYRRSPLLWNWIYFIQSPVKPYLVKIGKTQRSVRSRLAMLQCGSPVELNVVLKIRGHARLEGDFHTLFSEYRRHGEWFEPKGILADFVKRCRETNISYFGPKAAKYMLNSPRTNNEAIYLACMIKEIERFHTLSKRLGFDIDRLDIDISAAPMLNSGHRENSVCQTA